MSSSSQFLRDVPEFIENEFGESLLARTEGSSGFKELGPPDQVHLTKSNGKSNQKDVRQCALRKARSNRVRSWGHIISSQAWTHLHRPHLLRT